MAVKTMVGMSGGVDSSAAACLLQEQGYELLGVTLKLYNNEYADPAAGNACTSADDIDDARKVCETLGIEHRIIRFEDGFKARVMDHFVTSYEEGRTPNPCIQCNRHVKFAHMLRCADDMGYDYVATGHYARIQHNVNGRHLLLTAPDASKDQSYMLYCLTQEQLGRTLFPVGELSKEEARSVAETHHLINARKRDSQDICFVPDGDYAGFILRYTGKEYLPGPFVGPDGSVLGQHKGIIRYTIGQRRGLGLALPAPLYVCGKDMENNRVLLGDNNSLFSSTLTANDVNLIACDSIPTPIRVQAKVRYRQKAQWATVVQIAPDRVRVDFDEPQRAITPGQAVVFYDGEVVVGGGTIE